MVIIKHLPNFITLCNLFCGCIGIIIVLEGHITYAAYLIWLAAALDFLDGFVARLLNAFSPIGKELDSLADMVTFGVLPSIIMYVLLQERMIGTYWPWVAFIIAAFSALRLAKFNIDTRQSDSFIGLPTPANVFFISALPFVIGGDSFMAPFIGNAVVLIVITLLFSYLMVAEIKLLALKFKNRSWHDNKARFIFLALSALLILFFQMQGIPLIIVLYLLLSISGKKQALS